jgi:hypothetical protein
MYEESCVECGQLTLRECEECGEPVCLNCADDHLDDHQAEYEEHVLQISKKHGII